MPVSPKYKEYFNFLNEYSIKSGVKLNDSSPIDEQEGVDDTQELEIPDMTAADVEPEVSFEDPEAIQKAKDEEENSDSEEEVEELSKVSDLDRVKVIQDLTTKSVESIELYLANLENELTDLKMKTQNIPEMQDEIELLNRGLKSVTPVTPQEQAAKMLAVTHGTSVEDALKKYQEEQSPLIKIVGNEANENQEQPQKKEFTADVKNLKSVNDSTIKDSFYKF